MSVDVTKLPSGLTVITDSMPHLETAALGVWAGVGGRDEKPSEHGISHLLEHMAFKGTTRRSSREIVEEIEAVGGDLNAGTSTETTAYYARVMKADFEKAGPVMHLLLRYTQALITQMAQTAVCNRHHSLSQQLCRWLLLSLDRLQGNELVMTQELIANMLGVRREGVTEGALQLQKLGLIRYSRGRIMVMDRPGLEKRSCECYAVVKKEYDRLLPDKIAV